jgi:hypothetical protein
MIRRNAGHVSAGILYLYIIGIAVGMRKISY